MTLPKEGNKGSPPASKFPANPPKAKSGPAAPPPPPHRGAAHHYFPYVPAGTPNLPAGYEGHQEPPRGAAGGPGPYTTAQYEKARAGMTIPPPPYRPPPPVGRSSTNSSTGSPPSSGPAAPHVNHGRDQPPHVHYPPMPPPPHQERPKNGAYPPPPFREEHRPPHWPPRFSQGPGYPGSSQPYDVHQPPPGPYRFSDLSLRREAVSKLSSTAAAYHAVSSSNHLNAPNMLGEALEGREGATSPSQIESSHREEVTTMGCTCKKTKCLKLYCQCFAVKIYCGANCRCFTCHNTVKYEAERKDAIRMILLRNPSAFDTKFQKDKQTVVQDRLLAHKLGCKCRKSACMKKYCECYAGNVRCSANCRCVGCKNMPRGGLGSGGPGVGPNMVPSSSPVRVTGPIPVTSAEDGSPTGKRSEPWMMNAAHNLAFLKHGSPAPKKVTKRAQSVETTGTAEGGSIPSLGSEESPPPAEKPKLGLQKPNSSERAAVNALLMAAMAMTEMSGQNDTKEEALTPPKDNTSAPMEEDNVETPQKNLMSQFNSPKRKKAEIDTTTMRSKDEKDESDDEEEDESPKRELPGDNTPLSNEQKVKRSRLGSHKKFPRNLGKEMEHQKIASSALSGLNNTGAAMTTPKQKGQVKNKDLTPVSARCIDFRKMHVNETNAAQAETQN